MKEDHNEFLAWFAGFFDGEGSFCITQNKGRNYHRRPCFSIRACLTLRDDDQNIVFEMRERLGVGRVSLVPARTNKRPGAKPSVRWSITKFSDCRKLVSVFDKFPLRAKKKRDYEIWRAAVLHLEYLRSLRSRNRDYSHLLFLSEALKGVRVYQPNELTNLKVAKCCREDRQRKFI